MTADQIIEAVAGLSFQDAARVKDAAERRYFATVKDCHALFTPAFVKKHYRAGMTVTLVGLADRRLNGLQAVVDEVKKTKLHVTCILDGKERKTSIPASCTMPPAGC